MDINRFTEKAQDAIRAAQTHAVRLGNQQVDVEHLLAALLEQEGGLPPRFSIGPRWISSACTSD